MAAVTAAVIGAAASIYGAAKQNEALNASADYAESMAKINKRFADRQAEDTLERGSENARQVEKNADKMRGSQRAGLAAQGLALDSGSAQDIQTETAVMGAADAARVRNNAALEAWGIRTGAAQAVQSSRMQAEGMRNEGRSTLITSGIRGLSDVAGTAYKAYGGGRSSGQSADNAYANSRRYDR